MSTTAPSGNTPSSQASSPASQARTAGPGRPAEGTDASPSDLFSSLLGLLSDTMVPEAEAASPLPATAPAEEATPDDATALASVIDWLQVPASSLHAAGAPPDAVQGRTDDAPSAPIDPAQTAGTDLSGKNPEATTPQAQDSPEAGAAGKPLSEPAPPATPASTLAARGKASAGTGRGNERPTTLMLQSGDSVQWRSTSAVQAEGMSAAATTMNWSTARSTVALHHRFGLSLEIDTGAGRNDDTASAAGVSSPLTASGAGSTGDTAMGQRQGGATGDHAGLTAAEDSAMAEDVTDFAAPPSGTETEQTHEQELRSWTPGGLRQASLRVGQDGEEAIDIELSLRGQEVNIDFRTDNAEARTSLQASAGQTLSDLLQRSGMQLAGLSVGGQAVPDRQPQGQASAPARRPDASPAVPGVADAAAALPRRPAADGRSSLDLFV